ncbi:hypothetical protein QA601_04345 [Chitinispirillales bacterium ANBcel5]|uniref:hypothetical protein n=1 Tax=Cellulosispirillum alkaliphilum TaxID=3039283 RepID=UPI002A50C62C|nr:hypothetical protein [Chitinispirillales bacterium ANBcel5]
MKPILKWQYEQLIKELILLQGHETDKACPCHTEGELCIRKHLLAIEAYAQETLPIEVSKEYKNKLARLASEAMEHRHEEERFLCKLSPSPDIADWTREWRKQFESYCLGCDNLKREQKKEES